MLRQDRERLWLPAIAAVAGLLAAAVMFVPVFAIGWAVGGGKHGDWGGWVGSVFAAFAASVVAIYFQAALVIAATNGRTAATRHCRVCSPRRGPGVDGFLSWAALTTSVGMAIRAVEQRLASSAKSTTPAMHGTGIRRAARSRSRPRHARQR